MPNNATNNTTHSASVCGVFLTTLFLMEEGEAGLVSNSPAPGDAQE
jgi:hypothetical protein